MASRKKRLKYLEKWRDYVTGKLVGIENSRDWQSAQLTTAYERIESIEEKVDGLENLVVFDMGDRVDSLEKAGPCLEDRVEVIEDLLRVGGRGSNPDWIQSLREWWEGLDKRIGTLERRVDLLKTFDGAQEEAIMRLEDTVRGFVLTTPEEWRSKWEEKDA